MPAIYSWRTHEVRLTSSVQHLLHNYPDLLDNFEQLAQRKAPVTQGMGFLVDDRPLPHDKIPTSSQTWAPDPKPRSDPERSHRKNDRIERQRERALKRRHVWSFVLGD